MKSSILFLIFAAIVDLIVKSLKDKKKIKNEMEKRQKEINKSSTSTSNTRPISDLRKILDEEIKKERERQKSLQGKTESKKIEVKRQNIVELKVNPEVSKPSEVETHYSVGTGLKRVSEDKASALEIKSKKLRNDIVTGIVFSEILSGPRSLQNQRRSL